MVYHCHNKENMVIEILQEWLKGKGTAVSWQCLLEVVKKCEADRPEHHALVNKIEDKIKGIEVLHANGNM